MNDSGLNILVVDDEAAARRKILLFLKREEGIASISEADSGPAAVEAIRVHKPDLVFLDIQMPSLTGFEVIRQVGPERMPPVVFVTAYDQYALDAFAVAAVDYLLKPFHQERFHQACQRVRKKVTAELQTESLRLLLSGLPAKNAFWQRIMIKSGPRYFFVPAAEISHISAEGKYVRIHASKGRHLLRQTLESIEKNLDPAHFVRVHRSHIVNIGQVGEIQPWSHGDYLAIMRDGSKLPISRRYSANILGKN